MTNDTDWGHSQNYELNYWRNSWPYRNLLIAEIQIIRHRDAVWFLRLMQFEPIDATHFWGFAGTVLEVGCGPIGFFEWCDGVAVTAQDSLMAAYAEHLPFAKLGQRGATNYITDLIETITKQYDFVVSCNMLDHTSDWIEFLTHLARCTKLNGELLLQTGTRNVPETGHTQVFSHAQLLAVIGLLGFEVTYSHVQVPECGHDEYRSVVRATKRF